MAPESIWGYDAITAAYGEEPAMSWLRIHNHTKSMYPNVEERIIVKLIEKKPKD